MVDILKHHALGVLDNDKRGGCCWLYENKCNFYVDIVDDALKEKADDSPAMLSNNEFVFTADAVRAAGGGSVNKGAQRMYDLMKNLESKVV